MPQLRGHRGGGHAQLPQEEQGEAVKHIQAHVAPNFQTQTGGNGQVAQVAHRHGGEPGVGLQSLSESGLVLRAENPGQHGAEPCVPGVFLQVNGIQQGKGQV